MILSFHPCFEADQNRLCAGRLPDDNDLRAIQSADAVILPQGCPESLYRMAVRNCSSVFPNYDARFSFPGKLGQAQLFQHYCAPHPDTLLFSSVDDYGRYTEENILPFAYPVVLKLDWGGEGETVYLVSTETELKQMLAQMKTYEATGQNGFLIQKYIPSGNRSLRVVVIYRHIMTYWRAHDQSGNFYSSLAKGARIDYSSSPDLQEAGVQSVHMLCNATGINLAGFDLLFSEIDSPSSPLFLEVNYFFGRLGIGGSEAYYALLTDQIQTWMIDQKLI